MDFPTVLAMLRDSSAEKIRFLASPDKICKLSAADVSAEWRNKKTNSSKQNETLIIYRA